MTRLYHGSKRPCVPYVGQCWTDEEQAAEQYGPWLAEIEVDLDEFVLLEVEIEAERRDLNDWPGDRAQERHALASAGIDVVTYLDETPSGRQHWTWRLISKRAVSAFTSALTD